MFRVSGIIPKFLVTALLAGTTPAQAHDPGSPAVALTQTSAIGESVPPFVIEHWLQFDDPAIGTAVDENRGLPADSVYLLEFWATWCIPCVAGMDDLSKFAESERERGIRVIAITDEPLAKVVQFLRSKGRSGTVQFDRFRTTLASDTDGSVMASMVPEEFRNFRPFMVVIGKGGIVEWMGQDKATSRRVVEQVLQGTWDRESFRTQWLASLADQRERVRIQRDEDWRAAKDAFWNNAEFLGAIAFRIGFNFGDTVKNADLAIAEEFARRAVELTKHKSAYELSVLAQVLHKRGQSKEAVQMQRTAIQELDQDADKTFYESNLAVYERAASEAR